MADDAVLRLHPELLVTGGEVVTEVIRLLHAPARADARDAEVRSRVRSRLGAKGARVAAPSTDELRRWLACAMASLEVEVLDEGRLDCLAEAHPKIVALNEDLEEMGEGVVPGPAAGVLARLDQIAPADGEIDAQLLSYIDIALPGHAAALVRSYGSGARPVGQRAALRFAARSREYVDAYVDGALAAGRFPTMKELRAGSGSRGDSVFAAEILRGLVRRNADPRAAPHLNTLAPLVDELVINPELATEPSALPADVDAATVWRLAAEPITRDRLDAILAAPPSVRAAFGLVDAAEWHAIVADAHRRRRVMDLRADRPLSFKLPAPGAGEAPT